MGGDILEFDSYMVGGEDLGLEGNRLLEADNRLLLPVPLRTIVSNVISIRKTVYDPVLFRIYYFCTTVYHNIQLCTTLYHSVLLCTILYHSV